MKNFITSFDARYDRIGVISLTDEGTCAKCGAENIPSISMDSSEDEYGPGYICADCIIKALLEFYNI
jgi:DNA-directed RNA polymerase subunit RPC12/RpoP